ncbi:hypothetical protein OEA41_007209 [Lepraria neglecta]|uniref:Uncharacterized protein n=1 Tax=Lepraria neglecta TaxID=209136 RepID=A0AAE0DN18_9LECA|nr:hypothetical protein OEA41_007209 [Lepraria neglecta]
MQNPATKNHPAESLQFSSRARKAEQEKESSESEKLHPYMEDDWRPYIDDDLPLLMSAQSSPLRTYQEATDSRDRPSRIETPVVERRDDAGERAMDAPQTPRAVTLQVRTFNSQRNRHQSLPASLNSTMTITSNPTPPPSSPQRRALQLVSPNIDFPDIIKDMAANIKRIEGMLTHRPIIPMTPIRQPAPAPKAQRNEAGEAQRPRKKRMTEEERKRRSPELSRDVPMEQRLSDRRPIEVGKQIYRHRRHVGASYAFSYRGRLYAEYNYLLDVLNAEGSQAWDHNEKSRVKSS